MIPHDRPYIVLSPIVTLDVPRHSIVTRCNRNTLWPSTSRVISKLFLVGCKTPPPSLHRLPPAYRIPSTRVTFTRFHYLLRTSIDIYYFSHVVTFYSFLNK